MNNNNHKHEEHLLGMFHIPTKQFVVFERGKQIKFFLVPSIRDASLYRAKNILEEDFLNSVFINENGEEDSEYIKNNILEFGMIAVKKTLELE
jgi:hypothetical protein